MKEEGRHTRKNGHKEEKDVHFGSKEGDQRLFPMKIPTIPADSYTCRNHDRRHRHDASEPPQPRLQRPPPQPHRELRPSRSQSPPQDYQQLILHQLRFLRLFLLLVVLHQAGALGCRISEFTCSNYECVPTDAYCDGVPDCSDRSDEP
ncbi:uncharacterized protein LOC125030697, partial [Penaeus chinensis]|uniref:uncharacterized protein LOC125030697 n=1 Tax=Penaeus chinensis TaxID=139456 RepID=UPI001FB6F0A4